MNNLFKDKYVFTDNYNYLFFQTKTGIASKFKKKMLAEKFSELSEDEKNNSLHELTYVGKIKLIKYSISYDFSCDAAKVKQPKTFIDAYIYLENEDTNEKQYLICNCFTKTTFMKLPVIVANGHTIYSAKELNKYYGGTKNKFNTKKYYSYIDQDSIEPVVHFACDAGITIFINNKSLKNQIETELFDWLLKYKESNIDFMYLNIYKKIYHEYYMTAFDMFRKSVNEYMNAYNKAKAETFRALCDSEAITNPQMQLFYF